MIADTAIFPTSPWGSEMLFNKDLLVYNESKLDAFSLDMDIATLEAELERVKKESSLASETRRMNDVLNSTSCSVASSECSDEPCLDLDGDISDDLFPLTEDPECLNSSFSNLLEGAITGNSNVLLNWTENLEVEDIPPVSSFPEEYIVGEEIVVSNNDIVIPSVPSSPEPALAATARRRQKQKQICIFDDTKLWCDMSDEQQITMVEELSQIISAELGLREQLDVIRIIQPNADISTSDTEFVIDLDYLDDYKLHKIRDYIRQHQKSSSDNNNNNSTTSCDHCSQANSSVQRKHTKKQSRERRQQQKELRQRQRKEYRQMMKERRSGLFKKEEVLSLSKVRSIGIDPDGDDGDIDILE